jgi:hypothetical protein
MTGWWVLAFMWLKFLVLWRFFRLAAIAGGIQCPENMLRCFANNYDIAVGTQLPRQTQPRQTQPDDVCRGGIRRSLAQREWLRRRLRQALTLVTGLAAAVHVQAARVATLVAHVLITCPSKQPGWLAGWLDAVSSDAAGWRPNGRQGRPS